MIQKPDSCAKELSCSDCREYTRSTCPLNAEYKKWRKDYMDKASSIAGTNSFSSMLTAADFTVNKGGSLLGRKKKNDDLKKLDEEMVKDGPTSNVSDDKKEEVPLMQMSDAEFNRAVATKSLQDYVELNEKIKKANVLLSDLQALDLPEELMIRLEIIDDVLGD